jgi:hypothetical protein
MGRALSRAGASTVESFLLTNGITYTVFALYCLGNVLLFVNAAQDEYGRHSDFQRISTTVARGCGAVLNVNFAAVLLIASRSLVSFLRETPLTLLVSFDSLMPGVHSILGTLILVCGACHTLAHWVTYIIKNPWAVGYGGKTFLFVTGVLLCVATATIRVSAWASVRRKHHEVFRRLHVGGSVATYALLCVHGLHHGSPSTWKWVLGPILLYTLDYATRVVREKRSYLFISKHSALFQGQSVLRLRLPKVFHHEPGQYAELKVPAISRMQWHPFTIASAPHEDEMVFYVKAAGNWTTELFQVFADRLGDENGEDIEVHIRGPFGAPAQHVDLFDHLVLIGGGVGATPFCSVVKSLDNYVTHWAARGDRAAGSAKKRGKTRVAARSTSTSASSATSGAPRSGASEKTRDTFYTAPGFETASRDGAVDASELRSGEAARRSRAHRNEASIRSDRFAASIREDGSLFRRRTAPPARDAHLDWTKLSQTSSRSNATYWRAINTLPASHTCMESLDILITMSYGTPSLVRHMQSRRPEASANPLDVDLSILLDKRFLALCYMKSVTWNVALLWALLLRAFIAGIASLFGQVSLLHDGLTIYSSTALLAVDTALAAIVALGVGVPAALEAYELGAAGPASWVDLFLLTPCAVFGVVINVLALSDVGRTVNLFAAFTFGVIWPVTALLFLLRLVRVVGERVALGEKVRRDPSSTRSVDFIWTTPTKEDDSWLVEEFALHSRSPSTRLHRYITRGTEDDSVPGTGSEVQPQRLTTHFGRPDWSEILNRIAERSRNGTTVGLFICGPTSMASEVQEAATAAMRNSIVRGLQGGAHIMRSLEEVFGDEITANAYTGDSLEKGSPDAQRGCNVRLVFHKERFS